MLQHPIGAADKEEQRWMTRTLAAVGRRRRLVLAPNADAGSAGIRAALEGEHVVEHLPRRRFAGLLAGAKAIVGNSSAGLIEAAVLRTPCVNIGPRQAGREKPANVVDCDYGERDVRRALREAEALDLSRMRHPYGRGDAGWRIADHLARFACGGVPLRKRNRY